MNWIKRLFCKSQQPETSKSFREQEIDNEDREDEEFEARYPGASAFHDDCGDR